MPWSSKNGGNGGGDGPWGSGAPGGGQQNDIEELFKKSQDRLKKAMPGGKSGGAGPLFYFVLVIIAAVVGFLAFTVRVNTDQVGIVTQFGKYVRTLNEGLHIRLPSPIEQVYLVRPQYANRISIGGNTFNEGRFRRSVNANAGKASQMLTGDNNIVDVKFNVQWKIKDAKAFLFNVENPASTVREVAESAMREIVGTKTLDDVLNEELKGTPEEVIKVMQKTLDGYNAGIIITDVAIVKPDVPDAVIPAVNDVEAAKQDKDRLEQQAQAYKNKVVPEAKGAAAKIVEDAKAYKARVVDEAKGEAERFKKIYAEYAKAPEVTRKRLYLEMMERVFTGTDKVILDNEGKGPGVVPYLPLNELGKTKR